MKKQIWTPVLASLDKKDSKKQSNFPSMALGGGMSMALSKENERKEEGEKGRKGMK